MIKKAEDNMYRYKLIERKSIHSSITSSLERTLYEKSIETREHAGRPKKLSQEIGKIINLPNNKIDELPLLSTLHDIGKIAISEEILTNGRKLTEKEAIKELKRCSGTQFDPKLVDVFIGILSK